MKKKKIAKKDKTAALSKKKESRYPLPVTDPPRSRTSWLRILLPALLLAWLVVALIDCALHNSVTVDEFAHLPAGLVYWQTGDFSVYRHNPPLLRLLAAAPLKAAGIEAPDPGPDKNRWRVGYLFQRSIGERYHSTFMPARMMIAVFTVLTALLLFVVTLRALGWWAGFVALALFCFNPLVLAHGSLVTTDAGFGLAFFATCVAGGYFFQRPSWKRCFLLGILLGLALLTKFTALVLLPILLLAVLILPWLAKKFHETDGFGWLTLTWKERWLRLATLLLTAMLVLDIGYLFQGVGQPLSTYPLSQPFLHALAESPIGLLPCPLPAEYMLGFEDQYREASGIFQVYLLGHLTTKGWWYYYPLALLFKLPIMFYILLGILVGALILRKLQLSLLLIACLIVPAFAMFAFTVFTNIDLGVRYLLFLIPFACIAIAHLARPPLVRSRKILLVLCLIVYASSVIMYHRHYIAYFSEICGGPARGHLFLADSNLDWGQDLLRLRSFMQEKNIPSVAIAHFGLVDPALYGIDYVPLRNHNGPETVVISVNLLLGIDAWGQARGVEPYRSRAPKDRIGYSLWVFDRIH